MQLSTAEKTGWILNSPQFHCDAGCRFSLYNSSAESDTKGCLKDDSLALSQKKQKEIGKCTREINGLKELTTTKVPRKDYRFTCRPSKDRMGWYRGWQSLTFHEKPCLRWDEAPVKYPLESFSNVSSPSIDYTTLHVFSTTLSQHENYCRNPDNHPYGPWCFYKEGTETKRAPCFHTCITDIKKLCLAKAFFPYYQTPYLVEGAPIAPVDPRLLRTIKDRATRQQNERFDLSDLLDVADVIGSVEQATPLYSITLTTRHLAQARLAGSAVVTRKKCHQTGIRTLIAGPWTPVRDDTLQIPEDSSDEHKKINENLKDFLRVQFLAGRQGVDKPWKPCFTACEDNTITCWPNQTAKEPNKRLFYFGFKATNREQRLCLKWTEAMSVLYKYKAESIKSKPKKGQEKAVVDPGRVLQLFYYDELSARRKIKGRSTMNRFLDGGGRLLHSAVCLDLARLIEQGDNRAAKRGGDYQELLDEAYTMMFNQGPGCFSWTDESHLYVEYVPCFRPCPCGTPSIKAPFPPYRDMCQKKTGEYEPCTARRDARTLRIHQHNETLIPLPEAELKGVYTPLVITLVAAIVCFLISFGDQMAALPVQLARLR